MHRFLIIATVLLKATSTYGGSSSCEQTPSEQPQYCTQDTAPVDSASIPRSFGYLVYRAFEPMDVFGPIDTINYLGWKYQLDLHIISETMDPVTTRPSAAGMNSQNSSTFVEILPTTTLATAPDLDVLIVPGGIGSRSPYLNSTIDFIRDRYPKVKYFITVCTGALLASKAGVLDGKQATTNKRSWESITSTNDKVHWVPVARWVTDGNVWTSSGVSAGIDAVLAFIKCIYGESVALDIANSMEYERHVDSHWDPFSAVWNVTEA